MRLIVVDTNRWDRLNQLEVLKDKENLEIFLLDGYQISFNQLNIDGHVNNLAVVVGTYREIFDVDVAFGIFVHKERGNIIVIGRSGTNGLDVGNIMRALGGGGHPAAGSALIKSVNPDDVFQEKYLSM